MLDTIQESELFQGVSQRVINEIGKTSEELTYKKDAIIFKADEEAQYIYELVQGSVDMVLPEKNVVHLTTSEKGQIFGWSALVEPYVYTATAKCSSDTRVIRISRDSIERAIKRHPDEGLAIVKHLAGIISKRLRKAYKYIEHHG
jgi:CRP/FNR family transcriptional regulator, cyclic AMP receptor protein